MNTAQGLSLTLLLVMLVLTVWRKANIGLLALACAFILVEFSDLSAEQLFGHFPGGIFTLLVGVSLLFSHLERSGALSWLVRTVYQALGHRTYFIPWAGFILGAMISSTGALSTAPITLLVPVVAALSRDRPQQYFVNQMAVIIGANAAGLSPLNPTGKVIAGAAASVDVSADYQTWGLWLAGLLVGVVAVMILQFVFQTSSFHCAGAGQVPPHSRFGFRVLLPEPLVEGRQDQLQPLYAVTSGLAVLAFVGLVVFTSTNVGLTAISLAVIMMLLFRSPQVEFFARVPWSAVLLMCGLLTYVGALQELGTMRAIARGMLSITSNPALLLIAVAYLMALMCNIESSMIGVFGLVMPLVFSTFGQSPHLTLVLVAIAAPAVLCVVNPVHVAGTLVVGYCRQEDQPLMMRRLFLLAGIFAALGPGLLALIPMAFG